MRIERFELDGRVWVAVDRGDGLEAATAALCATLSGEAPTPGRLRRLERGEGRRIAPAAPSKVVCIGLNFRRHAEEMGKPLPDEPVVFLKPPSAVIATGDDIRLPPASSEVHFEGELAVVIGAPLSRATAREARDAILGFTILNDVTARDLQRADRRYTRAKGFDTFAPLGPAIVTGLDEHALRIETRVNGELRQDSGCDDFIFPLDALLVYVSSIMTLAPGDVLSTGTPAGVGPLASGDEVTERIDPIGVLTNRATSLG